MDPTVKTRRRFKINFDSYSVVKYFDELPFIRSSTRALLTVLHSSCLMMKSQVLLWIFFPVTSFPFLWYWLKAALILYTWSSICGAALTNAPLLFRAVQDLSSGESGPYSKSSCNENIQEQAFRPCHVSFGMSFNTQFKLKQYRFDSFCRCLVRR